MLYTTGQQVSTFRVEWCSQPKEGASASTTRIFHFPLSASLLHDIVMPRYQKYQDATCLSPQFASRLFYLATKILYEYMYGKISVKDHQNDFSYFVTSVLAGSGAQS